jgi:hypothetical protein
MFSATRKTQTTAAPCRQIRIPFGEFQAGQIVRLVNFTPERSSWIPTLLSHSEPVEDPGDEMCRELDVLPHDPRVMDFGATERAARERIPEAAVMKRYGFTSTIQIDHAVHHLSFPRGSVSITSVGNKPIAAERTWSAGELAAYDEHLGFCGFRSAKR